MLKEKAVVARDGSIVDASFVDATRQSSSREENEKSKQCERPEVFSGHAAKGRQKDCDTRWAVKEGETHYGYKNHTKVDTKSKLVVNYVCTAANVHDSQVFKDLVDESDEAVFADSANLWEEAREHLPRNDCQDLIMHKSTSGNPMDEEKKALNKIRSCVRVRCANVPRMSPSQTTPLFITSYFALVMSRSRDRLPFSVPFLMIHTVKIHMGPAHN